MGRCGVEKHNAEQSNQATNDDYSRQRGNQRRQAIAHDCECPDAVTAEQIPSESAAYPCRHSGDLVLRHRQQFLLESVASPAMSQLVT